MPRADYIRAERQMAAEAKRIIAEAAGTGEEPPTASTTDDQEKLPF